MHHTTAVVPIHELFISPEPESADASNTQEETTDRDQPDTRHSNSEDSYRPHNFSQQISDHMPEDNFIGQQQANSTEHNVFDKIPQLEEEDWENGQFTDAHTNLINRHNTHSVSEIIQKEYTKHLIDLTDNQYYSEEYSLDQLQYSIPDPDYYGPQPRRSYTQPQDPAGCCPPPPDQAEIQHWHACGRGKCTFLLEHRLFGEKMHSAKSRNARKR